MADRTLKRRPDMIMLAAGVLALLLAAGGFTGRGIWEYVDLRWLAAGVAMSVGVLFLIASLRHSRAASDDR